MKDKKISAVKLFIIVFLLVSVIFPLITVFLNIRLGDIKNVVQAPQFGSMIINSLVVTSISTCISVVLAFALAWCLNRTQIRFRAVFSVLFTIPMLIPSISHGMGLVLLFGDNGIITNTFGIHLPIFGYLGIIMGSLLYSFPVAFLMLTDIFQYEDYSTYEAAQVLGLSKWKQFVTITLPNMKKTLISVIFATFTLIFTDYGVPLVIGGKVMTLPVYMYREVVGLMNFSEGAIIGVLLLIPAFVAFIIDLKNDEGKNTSTVTKAFVVVKNKKRDLLAYVFCILTVILICMPIVAFCYLSVVEQYPIELGFSLSNVKEAIRLGAGMYLKNSLAIALMTSFVGVAASYFVAFLTARSQKTFTNLSLHLIAMVSLAIPGIVLGLSYVLFFKGSILYGTLAILIMVNMIHFFASPYLLAYNSLSKFNANLEDVSSTLGISKFRMLKDVYVPCTQKTIIEMFSYFFVNCMVTISAVSFLANFRNMPLALLIPRFDSMSLIEATAFVSIMILAVNGVMKLVVYVLKRKIDDVI